MKGEHQGGNMEHGRFTRKIEDFTCENCELEIKGTGYTNHCPRCLWSKHVDINPGDRLAECGGMMKPVATEYKSGMFTIRHRCVECGIEKNNKAAEADDRELLIVFMSGRSGREIGGNAAR